MEEDFLDVDAATISRKTKQDANINVRVDEIQNGIFRIAGFEKTRNITFNQFLLKDEKCALIHTGPYWMYKEVEKKSQGNYRSDTTWLRRAIALRIGRVWRNEISRVAKRETCLQQD